MVKKSIWQQSQRFAFVGIVLSLLIGLLLFLFSTPALASIAPEPAIPTTAIEWDGQAARVPDWSRISFRTLPPVLSDGSFTAPSDAIQAVGYDLSRQWKAGQTSDTYLKLGDFQTSLYPQIFNLHTLATLSQFDLQQVALSELEMIAWQTVDDLVTAIPGLSNVPVKQVRPIAQLLSKSNLKVDLSESIGAVLSELPVLGQLALGDLCAQLSSFAITDIPGLENIPLQNLKNWGNSTLGGVPGLADIPLDKMPNPVGAVGMLGMVDVAYGPAEQNRNNTISGSRQAGFAVACRTDCAHAELTASPALHGKQWISGQYQEVAGGEGVLKAVNGGQEPTGRHPFGDAFKVALWDVDESSGTVSTALFFRVCYRGIPDLGCTPYFLGPVPFLNYQEKSFMLVGLLDGLGGRSQPDSIPTGVMAQARALGIPANALPGGGDFSSGFGLCDKEPGGEGPGGVDFSALAAAFSSIEGNYGSVGSYVCDGDGNCGRGLGRYQYMSYRPDVRALLRQQSGGVALLSRLDAGKAISQAELERAFPAEAQDNIFKGDQSRNIQQAQQEGFSGKRLVERVGQIHFGGPGAPIDGGSSDVHGRLTLKTYGEELANQYNTAIAAGAGKRCTETSLGKAAPAGATNQSIYQSMGNMGGFDTSMGPDGGNLACAWAVNRVLADAGVQPLGANTNYVPSVEADLQNGRGTQVAQSEAQAGDIVIEGSQAHIGICLDDGCTQVRSNSSSRARFAWDSGFNFNGFYGGGSSRVYRIKQ
ncbi:MAG: hypothetical protein AAGC93_08050 [Cyanobacteria bacterium P01_F01_bin.53]